jgi:hypothetical protein
VVSLVPLLLVLGQAGTPAQFGGVTYVRPDGWQERTEGQLRALVPPTGRPGQVLMVLIAPSAAATNDPATELTRLADAAEKGATHHQRGPVQSRKAGPFTLTLMMGTVDQPGIGLHQRIYQLVSDGRRSAFVTALSKGDETFKEQQPALLQLMGSVRPVEPGAPGEPRAGAGSSGGGLAAPVPPGPAATHAGSAPGGSGIPYGVSRAPVLDPHFLPSGQGREIPAPALTDGRPLGIWWSVHNTRSPFFSSGAIDTTVFLADGTLVHYFRPGGPHLVDLEGMRALGDADFIGRYSVSGGTMTTEIGKNGEYRRSKPLTVRHDAAGTYFLFDGAEYHPAVPLTRQSLVGTWRMGAMGTFTFRPDGTVVTTANMIDASWGRKDTKEVLTGAWVLDGYLLALRFPADGARVYTAFGAGGGSIVVRQTLLTRE